MKLFLSLLLAGSAGAASWFDGAGVAPVLPPAPRAPVAVEIRAAKKIEAPTPDLFAAGARVGNAAMLARLTPRESGPFTFAVIGDLERGRFWWERIFTPGKDAFIDQWRAAQKGTDFVLQLGDFVSKGTVKNYRRHVELIEHEALIPILRTIGNHDRSRPNGAADKSLYDAVFGARDWYFDHAGWRFVSLDSSDRKVTAAQLEWLAAALAVPGPKVIFTHVPPKYIRKITPLKEVGEPSTPDPNNKAAREKSAARDFFTNYFADGSAEFEDLVEHNGVKAVYMGHIHSFWAADHHGVRYVISGGGGSPLYPLPPSYPNKHFAHYLRVTADASGLSETVVPYKGAPFILPPVKP